MTGSIILARHGEPALSRAVRLDWRGYRDWWGRYEEGGLKPDQTPSATLVATAAQARKVVSSTRLRARETAAALCPNHPPPAFDLFIEAPLPSPPFPRWLRFSPRGWGVIARFWWAVFNYHDGQESVAQAEARARRAAEQLIAWAQDGDVVLVAHGYFNFMIGRALRRLSWRRGLDEGFGYWSSRRFDPPDRPKLPQGARVG